MNSTKPNNRGVSNPECLNIQKDEVITKDRQDKNTVRGSVYSVNKPMRAINSEYVNNTGSFRKEIMTPRFMRRPIAFEFGKKQSSTHRASRVTLGSNYQSQGQSLFKGTISGTQQCQGQGPSLVVETQTGSILNVYKNIDGTCWYEITSESTQDDEKAPMLKDKPQQCMIDDEVEFMEKHLDSVVNPDSKIRNYQNAKWMINWYVLLCFIADIYLQFQMSNEFLKHQHKHHRQESKQNTLFLALNFFMSLITTCQGIKTLSENDKIAHTRFHYLLFVNLATELMTCFLAKQNIICLILRLSLLGFDVYFVQNHMARALTIKKSVVLGSQYFSQTEVVAESPNFEEHVKSKSISLKSGVEVPFELTVQEEEEEVETYCEKVYTVLNQAIPAILTSLAFMMQENINLIFLGQLNKPAMMAGVGMGNMFINMIGLTPAWGLHSALETLVSQDFGSDNYELCGIHLNRSRIVLVVIYVPISLILLQTETILVFLNQDAEVAKFASEYIRAYLPGMILMAFIDGQRRFLNMMNLTKGPLVAIAFSVCFHLYLSWYFVWNLDYGIVGTGYAATITNLTNYVLLLIISVCDEDIRKTMVFPDSRSIRGIKGYLKQGAPIVFMSAIEFWVYDIMILMAGYIGVQAQACQIIAITIIEFIWMTSIGLQTAASSCIGQQIGRSNKQQALDYFKVLNQISGSIFFTIFVVINLNKRNLVMIFTKDEEIIELTAGLLSVAFIGTLADLWHCYIAGVIRALGLQHKVVWSAIIAYWGIQIPGALLFAFYFNLGHKGIWISMVMAQWFIACNFQYICISADWDEVILESENRRKEELEAESPEPQMSGEPQQKESQQ